MHASLSPSSISDHTAINPFLPMRLFILVRWIALLGQGITIAIVYAILGFNLPMPILLSLLGISAFINVILTLYGSERLSSQHICFYLLYDLGQLTAMMFVTGALNNPFTILMIAPLAIAAGFLPKKLGIVMGISYVLCIGILAFSPYPLPWYESGLTHPSELKVGIVTALITAGAFTFYFMWCVASELRQLSQALMATQMALGKEQKIASLGALAAAAAHELGSPLTTITLVAKEMRQSSLALEQGADIDLIIQEVNRCRDILQELARNFSQEHNPPLDSLPVTAAIHMVKERLPSNSYKDITIVSDGTGPEPEIKVSAEWVHGIHNILQNACQFAHSHVLIMIDWHTNLACKKLNILISDDGPGYASDILPHLGEPYVSGRLREEECHLGLGLFIAQTLLAHCNTSLHFYNEGGACCLIRQEI